MILMPIVGFDLQKNRLGYGGGYYDRTISFWRKSEVFKIGIGFDEQEVKSLPSHKYDKKLDL